MIVLVFASIAVAQSIPDQSSSAQNSPDQVQSPDSSGQVAPAQNTETNSDGRAAPAQKNTMSVVIHHHAFDPEQQNVPPGTIVTWTNEDNDQHTVTADNGLFDSGVLNPGDSYSVWFDGSGIVPYHCGIHPYMKGSIVVGGASGGETTGGGTTTENPGSNPPNQATSVYP